MGKRHLIMLALLSAGLFLLPGASPVGSEQVCRPTEPDALGPFYKQGAPVRSSVGKGYALSGVVRSAADCSPVGKARIEFWLAGPDGEYGDDYRATVVADGSGGYRFESHFPPPYYGRPSHIHIRVSADGFRTLVTQHYPVKGQTQAAFDLVLVPAR
jgi:protocatechuate 3,4-dioxygenase beta subunit